MCVGTLRFLVWKSFFVTLSTWLGYLWHMKREREDEKRMELGYSIVRELVGERECQVPYISVFFASWLVFFFFFVVILRTAVCFLFSFPTALTRTVAF